ncbi:fibronectin type III domain-containing protein [Paenibacillus sp. FSL R5-0908]
MRVLTDHLSGTLASMPPLPAGIHEAEALNVQSISSTATHEARSLRTASGGKYDLFNATKAGDYIEYKVNVPAAGTYHVTAKVPKSLSNGIYQLSIDGVNQGNAFDAYYFTVDDDKIYDLGYVEFAGGGDKLIRFTSTGKNVTATGYKLPLDYIQLSPFSGTVPSPAPVPTPDTQAPSAPAGVTLKALSLSQVNVKWNKSTDNVGVVGYIIYRDGTEIGRTTTTDFTDNGVTPSVSHDFTVKAYDRQNLSAASETATIKTVNTVPVFLPIEDFNQIQYTVSKANVGGNIVSKAALDEKTGKITLTMDLSPAWIAHEQHPLFYYVPLHDGGEVIARLTSAELASFAGVMVAEKVTDDAPRLLMTGLTTDAYSADWGTFKVQSLARTEAYAATDKNRHDAATDAVFKQVNTPFWAKLVRTGENISSYIKNSDGSWGNGKGASTPLRTVAFSGLANSAPVYAGVGMTGDKARGGKWSAEFDSFSLPNYPVPATEGEAISFPVKTADPDGQTVAVSITESNLPGDADYSFTNGQFTWNSPKAGTYKVTFAASDGLDQAEPMSVVLQVAAPDTVAPSAPSNVTVTPVSSSQLNLKWTNSTDNLGVEGYKIYCGEAEVGTSATPSFSDTGLSPSTTYTYYVKAFDKAGNLSPASNSVTAVTDSMPLSFLPVVDFSQVQYTVSASTAEGTIASSASMDEATGKIRLTLDFARASKAHEQHPIFYYVPLYGDGEVIARLTDAAQANYAGVMITDRITDDIPRLLMTGLTTDGYSPIFGPLKIHSFARTEGTAVLKNRHESTQDEPYKNRTTPFWVKMVRTGTQISSYIQNSNGSWGNGKGGTAALRTVTFSGLVADAPVYAGVAVSGDKVRGNNWSAEFDNFSISTYTLPVTTDAPVSFPVKVVSPTDEVNITISNKDLPAGAQYSLENGQFTWNNPKAGTYSVTFAANDGHTDATPMTINLKVSQGSTINVSELQALITSARAYDNANGHYTAESFASLQQAIAAAEAALATITTEQQLNDAIAALQQAVDNLQEAPQSGELAALLSGPSTLHAGQNAEWTVGLTGLGSAEAGFNTADLVVNYDPAVLEFETDTDANGHLLLKEGALQITRSGFQVVGTAVKPEAGQIRIMLVRTGEAPAAENGSLLQLSGKVKADASASSTTVSLSEFSIVSEGQTTVLDTGAAAVTSQIVLADKTALNNLIAEAKALLSASTVGMQPGQYPQAAADALQTAVDAAQAVADDANANAAAVGGAVGSLQSAMNTFRSQVIPQVPGADKTELTALIGTANGQLARSVEGSKVGQYTPGSKAALQTAIAAAQAVVNQPSATEAQVAQAKTALSSGLQQFSKAIITMVDGATQVTLLDLSIIARYFGITSQDAHWSEVSKADMYDEHEITIRALGAVARLILDDWLAK